MAATLDSIRTEDGAFELRLQPDRLVLERLGWRPPRSPPVSGVHSALTAIALPYFACRQVVYQGGELHFHDPAGLPLKFDPGGEGARFQLALRQFSPADAQAFARVASERLEAFWHGPAYRRWWMQQRWRFPSTRAARRLWWLYDHMGPRWLRTSFARVFKRYQG
ncbi:hypothetical protein [Deinococcus aluminii]|uniref:hypothetical protein n=1 Tax=Deinococcus aluminii TaxID=1656885 RepID=UPI0031E66D59